MALGAGQARRCCYSFPDRQQRSPTESECRRRGRRQHHEASHATRSHAACSRAGGGCGCTSRNTWDLARPHGRTRQSAAGQMDINKTKPVRENSYASRGVWNVELRTTSFFTFLQTSLPFHYLQKSFPNIISTRSLNTIQSSTGTAPTTYKCYAQRRQSDRPDPFLPRRNSVRTA